MKKVNSRKLLDGSYVDEFDKPIDITIHTKCPSKWKLTDMRTGQEYIAINSQTHKNILGLIPFGLKQNINIYYGTWLKKS
jgi:hypothetical protein